MAHVYCFQATQVTPGCGQNRAPGVSARLLILEASGDRKGRGFLDWFVARPREPPGSQSEMHQVSSGLPRLDGTGLCPVANLGLHPHCDFPLKHMPASLQFTPRSAFTFVGKIVKD